MIDYYKILKCRRHTLSSQKKNSLRKATLKWQTNAEENKKGRRRNDKKNINIAYEIFSDPQKMNEKQGFKPCKHLENNYNTGGLNPMALFAQIYLI